MRHVLRMKNITLQKIYCKVVSTQAEDAAQRIKEIM